MKLRVLWVGALLTVAFLKVGRAAAQEATPGTAAAPAPPVTATSEPAAAATPPAGPAAPSAPLPASTPSTAPGEPPAMAVAPTGATTSMAPNSASDTPSSTPQEAFGFGAQIGFYNPNGVSVRAGARAIALQVIAGFTPKAVSYGGYRDQKYEFFMTSEVTAQAVIYATTFRNEIRGHALIGYRYNGVYGHGAMLGAQIEKRVTRKLLLEGLWGFSYYPAAADRVRGDKVPKDADFGFPPPQIDFGVSVGLLFFP